VEHPTLSFAEQHSLRDTPGYLGANASSPMRDSAMSTNLVRRLINFWPPFLFSGIRVKSIAPDWRQISVELRLRWWNRNAVGTLFGGSLFARDNRMTKAKKGCRFAEFSDRRTLLGCELNVNSIGTARARFLKNTQRRYRPLAALLCSALGHRVMIVADGEEWKRTHSAIVPHLQATAVAQECAPVIKSVAERIFVSATLTTDSAGQSTSQVFPRSWRLSALLWAVFARGIVIQASSTHLVIRNHAFWLPATATRQPLDPARLINRERKLQALSALLVLGGGTALAFHHRRTLIDSFYRAKKPNFRTTSFK